MAAQQSVPHPIREYALSRTDQPDLVVRGRLLAGATSRDTSRPDPQRWHEISVIQTPDNYIAVAIGYRSTYGGESPRDDAELINCVEEVEPLLSLYNATESLPPSGKQPSVHAMDTSREVLRRYDLAVCRLLEDQQWQASRRHAARSVEPG